MRQRQPKQRPMTLTTFSKDGLTTFHLQFNNRRFGLAVYGPPTATNIILAFNAFSRTIRKEFLEAKR